MQANLWYNNYSIYCFNFGSEKAGKEGEEMWKLEYLKNEKSFLVEIKIIFHNFWRVSVTMRKLKWKKVADTFLIFVLQDLSKLLFQFNP